MVEREHGRPAMLNLRRNLRWPQAIGLAIGFGICAPGYADYPASDSRRWMRLLSEGDGKAYVVAYCTACHDLRIVLVQSKDRTGWTATVLTMLERLGTGSDREADMLIDYLSANFGPQNALRELPIRINRASAAELARVPGMTPDTAQGLVSRRPRHGFASLAALTKQLADLGADPIEVLPFLVLEQESR